MDKPTEVSFLNIFRSLSAKIGCLFQRDWSMFLFYICTYALLLIGAARGVGQFWDWSFPYFGDQVKNVFWNYAFSWLGSETGSPLPYMSDYYVRIVISAFGFIPPEIFRYCLLVLLLSLISFGVYRILRKTLPDVSRYLACAAGLTVSINPTMFYKLLAGHVNYLISMAVLVFLIYFALVVFQNTKRRYGIILGLFVAFVGAQIQFFTFALIFLGIYFLVYKEKRSIQTYLFLVAISFLVNLPWLTNFLVGVVQVSDISQVAAEATSRNMSFQSITDVLHMTFSKATLIDRFYSPIVLQSFASIFVLLLVFLCIRRGGYRSPRYIYVYTIIALLIFEFSIPLLSNFYYVNVLSPVFRESGHFGPIILLLLVLSLSSWILQKREQYFLAVLFTVFVFVNIPVYASNLPYLNFASVREKFSDFKKVLDGDTTNYRVLTYPFFSPYSFTFEDQKGGVIPLSNAGNDSFMSFVGKSRVSNLVRPHAFESSPQYQLKKTNNINILKTYNVKYIFDFSSIYNSEYKRYLPTKMVKGNEDVLDSDKGFLRSLQNAHSDELIEISPGIYKLSSRLGSVFGFDTVQCMRTKERDFSTQLFYLFGEYVYGVDANCNTQGFADVLNFSKMVRDEKILEQFKNGTILKSDTIHMYTAAEAKEYYVKNTGNYLEVYIKEKEAGNTQATSSVQRFKLDEKGARYFVQVRDKLLQAPENIEVYIGTKVDTPKVTLLKEKSVKMNFVNSGEFELDPKATYIVSFDYKGRRGSYLGYTIQDNELMKNKITDRVLLTDNAWNTYIKIYRPGVISKKEGSFEILYKDVQNLEYANKKISTLTELESIVLDTESGYAHKAINRQDVFDMINSYQNFYAENLIDDGGFEKSTWNGASVCHKDGPEYTYVQAEQVTSDKVEGNSSLVLKAQRTVACVKKSVQVKAGASYRLGFNFKGDVGNVASYRIDYNNAKGDQFRDVIDIADKDWGSYEKEVIVPTGATKATIYLFSRGSGSNATVSTMYDNVSLRRSLYSDNSVYLVDSKEQTLQNNKIEIWYKDVNPTKTEAVIMNASEPFFIGYSEAFHSDWKVRPSITKGGISANPMHTAGTLPESTHYRVNEYFNAWYVDPVDFCTKEAQSCERHEDGVYTMHITIEFWPQRWFVIFLTISFLTLGITIFSLIHAYNFDHINYRALFRRKTPDIL